MRGEEVGGGKPNVLTHHRTNTGTVVPFQVALRAGSSAACYHWTLFAMQTQTQRNLLVNTNPMCRFCLPPSVIG